MFAALLVTGLPGCMHTGERPRDPPHHLVATTHEDAPPDSSLPLIAEPDWQDEEPPIYFEGLPEVITKVEAEYPAEARRAGIEGVVIIRARVGKDGRVTETQLVESIPMLDAAATAAARQYVFKPVLDGHEPVVIWVDVPIRFSLAERSKPR